MKLNIKVIPNSKQEKVIQEEQRLKVYVKSPALEGKANKALIELLAMTLFQNKMTRLIYPLILK